MKTIKFLAVIALAIGIVAFHSCKKDELTDNNDPKALSSTFNPNEIENMDEYLMGFMKDLKTVTRDSEAMPLEDAVWHLSACLNFQFCNANVERTHVVYDTVYTTINVNDGYVSLSDINASLLEISTEVLSVYNSSDLENKNVLFIKPEIQDEAIRGGNTVRTVVATSGRDCDFGYHYFDNDSIPLSLFTEDYYNWSDAADTLDFYINIFKPEKPTDPSLRTYYVTLITIPFNFRNYPGRLYYCGNCTNAAVISKERMAYYLDSYLGLIEDNGYPYSYISSDVSAEWGNIAEYEDDRLPEPQHHLLIVNYGLQVTTVHPGELD